MNPRKRLWRKTHRQLELIISLEDIAVFFPLSKRWPIHESAHPGPMSIHGHRKIATMNHAVEQRCAHAFAQVPPAHWNVESARIPVKIRPTIRHPGENVEIFRVEDSAFRGAMRRNHGNTAIEWQR